jgi:hypothetical protein
MRQLAVIPVLAILIAGCWATSAGSSTPASSAGPTANPTGPVATLATPSATPTSSPAPKVVAGWPVTAQGAVTMTGRDLEEEAWMTNSPVIEVKVTGLVPGEVASLSGTGRYDRDLFCGPLPSGCQDIYTGVESGKPVCMPEYSKRAKGRVTIARQATADATGTARATLRFIVPETKDACPVEGGGHGWFVSSGEWKVRVTERAHGLRLTPDRYVWGP